MMALVAGSAGPCAQAVGGWTPLIAVIACARMFIGGCGPARRPRIRWCRAAAPSVLPLIAAGPDYVHFTGSTATGRKIALYRPVASGSFRARSSSAARRRRSTTPTPIWIAPRARRWSGARSRTRGRSARRSSASTPTRRSTTSWWRVSRADEAAAPGRSLASQTSTAGVMTWERQREIVEARVKDALARGAKLVTGGAASAMGASATSRRSSPAARRTWTCCAARSSARSCRSCASATSEAEDHPTRERLRPLRSSRYVFTRRPRQGCRRIAEQIVARHRHGQRRAHHPRHAPRRRGPATRPRGSACALGGGPALTSARSAT